MPIEIKPLTNSLFVVEMEIISAIRTMVKGKIYP